MQVDSGPQIVIPHLKLCDSRELSDFALIGLGDHDGSYDGWCRATRNHQGGIPTQIRQRISRSLAAAVTQPNRPTNLYATAYST